MSLGRGNPHGIRGFIHLLLKSDDFHSIVLNVSFALGNLAIKIFELKSQPLEVFGCWKNFGLDVKVIKFWDMSRNVCVGWLVNFLSWFENCAAVNWELSLADLSRYLKIARWCRFYLSILKENFRLEIIFTLLQTVQLLSEPWPLFPTLLQLIFKLLQKLVFFLKLASVVDDMSSILVRHVNCQVIPFWLKLL